MPMPLLKSVEQFHLGKNIEVCLEAKNEQNSYKNVQ